MLLWLLRTRQAVQTHAAMASCVINFGKRLHTTIQGISQHLLFKYIESACQENKKCLSSCAHIFHTNLPLNATLHLCCTYDFYDPKTVRVLDASVRPLFSPVEFQKLQLLRCIRFVSLGEFQAESPAPICQPAFHTLFRTKPRNNKGQSSHGQSSGDFLSQTAGLSTSQLQTPAILSSPAQQGTRAQGSTGQGFEVQP